MNTFPTLVGFYLAIGVGLIANTLFTIFYDLGRRFYHTLAHNRGRLAALGLASAKEKDIKISEDELLGLAHLPWTNLYALSALFCLILSPPPE